MGGGRTMALAPTVWLIFIPVIVTFGNSDYHEKARRELTTDIPGFISIDCGAAKDYYDEDTGIFYESDTGLIDTGTKSTIPPEWINSPFRQQLKNLRSFPQGKKNCYTLKPEQGKNNNYMIRAFFHYGNYDGKNQAPVFDLYLGVNKWDTINSSTVNWREIIHFSMTDNIYVCLVNTGSGIPFISALELRLLKSSIYNMESGALQLINRYYFTGSKNGIRYKDDIYDRIWTPLTLPDPQEFFGWDLVSTQSTIDTQSSNDAYCPPEEVLRTAAQTKNSSSPLTLQWKALDTTSGYYFYFHFAEIQDLEDGHLRELNISLNGEYQRTEPIKLEYLKPLTVGPLNLKIKDTGFAFTIHATKESNLPPILNAFETYVLKMLPYSPTDLGDVNAIVDIKQVYSVAKNWQGDPCVPSDYSWDGLNCSYDINPPRIISLNLASSGLTGKIATSFSNLKSIVSLDLSNNDLTGPVPEFLAQLPSLRTLNLTGNKLSGSIPQTVWEKIKDGSLLLSAEENPNLCQSASCEAKKNFVVPVVASVLALILLSTLVMIFCYCKRKRQQEFNVEGSLKSKNQEFTYSDIVSITNNFETVIGEGGFGKVYLGTLKNGCQVAVKVRSASSSQGPKEFRAEAKLLMRAHHINLVSFIGYCNKGTHMVLVYEYMANGNLRQHLSEITGNVLNWQQRLQIAIDAAQGLEYLHNGCKPPIIHRDMKTTNILLNERLQAKIADFGLSRDFKNEGDSHVYTDAAGTPAYIDPEYHTTGKFNKKSDVYSFGIVLLELITGHSVIIRGPKVIHIIQWIRPIIERGDIQNIVDQRLHGDFSTNSAWKAVEIAMSCIPSTAIQRPDMSHVVVELKECLATEMAPEGVKRMVSSETRPRNSLEVGLEFEMVPNAR